MKIMVSYASFTLLKFYSTKIVNAVISRIAVYMYNFVMNGVFSVVQVPAQPLNSGLFSPYSYFHLICRPIPAGDRLTSFSE